MISAAELRKRTTQYGKVNKAKVQQVLENIERDIIEAAGKGENRIRRNVYSVWIGSEDRGLWQAVKAELEELGYTVKGESISYYVGATTIAW